MPPLPRLFLRKRVHKVMKTKGRRCKKKMQRVRILLRTLQIARVVALKDFGSMVTPLRPVLVKRVWKALIRKDWCWQMLKKEAVRG
jgi:hypothetical protein